ncbi:hypothetical protein [Photobacterium atrarenae]|uniref:DUF4194 domain-containing protein n=1 Tax=Photobacterium atrarenae TaxID=865757 RepID=A0ABY5GNW1_9GAMM|nr:hypothetical protein [Photobacterium atrarenae]UTV30811.1 hypothetical protein NNL38_19835 [Photobacterium atrarenae]
MELNKKSLISLTEDNSVVYEILDYIYQERVVNRAETNVSRLVTQLNRYNGSDMSRRQIISAFRQMEECGAGRLIKGAHGHPTRFSWADIGMIQIANIALAYDEDIVELFPSVEVNHETYVHTLQLRHGYDFEIELPTDLTADEAERIASVIQGLCIELDRDNLRKVRVYDLPLRKGFDYELELPLDLTWMESIRLSDFIRTLPIDSGPEEELEELARFECDLDELDDDEF